MPNNKIIIEPGTVFGRLTVMYESPIRKNRAVCYHCKCECGNEVDVRSISLRNGDTKSCGCYSREQSAQRQRGKFHDLTGQRFGKLIAIAPTEERNYGSVVWKCACDCGKETYVSSKNLVYGDTKSCGCLRSKGELLIAQLLTENNIPFKQEYSFDGLVSEKGYSLRYDFFVDNKYLIEFDGEQYFNNRGLFSHDNFEERQRNDNKKNDFAKENNIPLIRIPYTKLKTLSINDLCPT